MAENLRTTLIDELTRLEALSGEERLAQRMDKIRHYGQFTTA